MPTPLNTRQVHIAVILDGEDEPKLYRRRNPQQIAWEMYAHKRGYDIRNAGVLALTYQAWFAAKPGERFETWQDRVDDVYPAAPDGTRLVVHDGVLCLPGGEELDDEPDPTLPDESGL